MHLQTYLSVNSLTQAELADHLGKRPQTVWRWCNGIVLPPRDDVLRIYIWTKGQVQPNDFYDLPELADADAPNPVSATGAPARSEPPAGAPTPLLQAMGAAA